MQSQANFNTGINTLGALTVQGQASFSQYAAFYQSVGIAGSLTVGNTATFTGSVLLENSTNSPTAFQVENSSGGQLIVGDTTDSVVGIGLSPTAGSGTLQVSGNINIIGSGSQLEINGTMVCSNTAGTGSTPGCTNTSGGGSYINNSTTLQTANFFIQSSGSNKNVIKASSGGSDLLDFQNSSGTVIASFDNSADLTLANNLTVNGIATLNGSNTLTGSTTIETTSNGTALQIQSATAAVTLLSANTSTLTMTISGANTLSSTSSYSTLDLNNTRFESTQTSGDIPTIGSETSCATSPAAASVTSGSTDSAGSFTMNSGTGTQSVGCTVTVSFYKAYSSAPKSVIISGANTNADELGGGVSAVTSGGFTATLPKTSASSAYEFYYWVIE